MINRLFIREHRVIVCHKYFYSTENSRLYPTKSTATTTASDHYSKSNQNRRNNHHHSKKNIKHNGNEINETAKDNNNNQDISKYYKIPQWTLNQRIITYPNQQLKELFIEPQLVEKLQKINQMNEMAGLPQGTVEWKQSRREMITASYASAFIKVSRKPIPHHQLYPSLEDTTIDINYELGEEQKEKVYEMETEKLQNRILENEKEFIVDIDVSKNEQPSTLSSPSNKHSVLHSYAAYIRQFKKENDSDKILKSTLLNSYDSAKSIIKRKINKVYKSEHESMVWGTTYEPIARRVLSKYIWPSDILEFGLMPHPKFPWLGCSVDGVHKETGMVVEIKCPWKFKAFPSDLNTEDRNQLVVEGIPRFQNWVQTQLQLEILNLSRAVILECRFVKYDSRIDFSMDDEPRLWKGAHYPFIQKPNTDIFDLPTQVEEAAASSSSGSENVSLDDWIESARIPSDRIQFAYLDHALMYIVERDQQWFNNIALPYLKNAHHKLKLAFQEEEGS